jgi:sensor c-di-GMP phosphodiesterase-like protein
VKPRLGIPLAVVVAVFAFLLPTLVSLQLAWKQGINDEKAEGVRYAAEVVRRGEETASQFDRTIQLLNTDHFARCSPQEIDLMRQIDIGSSYLQMVARISGDTVECTSLGTTEPTNVGRPTLTTEHGVHERIDVHFGPRRWDHLDLVDRDGVAVLVDSTLLIDLQTERGVGLAMIVPSNADHAKLAETTERFQQNWLNPLSRGQSASFLDGGYVISQVRSKTLDIAAVSAVPSRYAYHHVKEFAAIFIPIGALCGIGLAWSVLYICRWRWSLPGLVRAAARHGDFFVEYQPVVEIASRRVIGAEALVRLRRDGTIIGPSSFIGLAEESGVASLITKCVIRLVSRDLPRVLALYPDFRVSINLTATDLKTAATAELLEELLHRSGAAPGNVVLEATEHGLVNGPECQRLISALRRRGFLVAIDDFGTGYSSLSCLQQLDLDLLKVDKAFVDTIGTDAVTSGVVLHIIEIARLLKLHLVAEGVETEAQAVFLLHHGVEYAQGWLFGRPMSVEALLEAAGQGRSSDLSSGCQTADSFAD